MAKDSKKTKDQLPNEILHDLASSLNMELDDYNQWRGNPENWSGMLWNTNFRVDSLCSDNNKLTIMLSKGDKKRKMVLKIESFTDAKDDNE